jgi:hypothetical protein
MRRWGALGRRTTGGGAGTVKRGARQHLCISRERARAGGPGLTCGRWRKRRGSGARGTEENGGPAGGSCTSAVGTSGGQRAGEVEGGFSTGVDRMGQLLWASLKQ